jgi:tRNA dimethylallyltransferase
LLALRLAELLPIEIVSCDSQQVYAGMDIGTGKPTIAERRMVPHHLLDIVVPTEVFHAARWAALARVAIQHIVARGHVPVVVGGTGLYLRALLSGLFEAPPSDPAIRERHKHEANAMGVEALHARLVEVDSRTAARVAPKDLLRISRALEVYEQTGVPISALQTQQIAATDIAATTLVLDPPLDVLRQRIGGRFDAMIAAGLLDETRTLRERFGSDARALQALGYRQIGEHLDGILTLDEAMAVAKAATSAYARRQRTWFRKEPDAWRFEAPPAPADVAARWKSVAERPVPTNPRPS